MDEERTYSIAGLKVMITGKQTASAIRHLPGFSLFEVDNNCDTDVNILVDNAICMEQLPGINPVHNFSVLEIDHTLSSFLNGYYFEMHNHNGVPVVSMKYDVHKNEVVMSSCNCELSLKFAVWVAYSIVALSKNIVPLHASAIIKNGYAVLFLGESGTGKSTHTNLWVKNINGSYLLNDDCPLVQITGDQILAFGSPWSGKTHCYRQEAVPVKAIVRLRQSAQNKIVQLGTLKSIGAIYPSCPPLFAYDNKLAGKMAGAIDKIVSHIPVYSLECLPDPEAAEIAYSAIF